MPDRMPEDMPEDMSDRMPEDMPDRMPDYLPDRMPEDMPEHMPDRMPEDLPVRKCINVMVGITRSKVFFFWAALGKISRFQAVFPAGPEQQPVDQSVPRRTSTASSGSNCSSLPGFSRELLIRVFPAGPQPQRISEDIPDRMQCNKEFQKISQIDAKIYARRYIRIDAR